MKQKHPNIINISQVEARVQNHKEKFGFIGKRLGPLVGAKSIGASFIEIPPGRQAFPNHFHCANEEAVFVVEGSGLARIGKDEIQIEAGDYLGFPAGPEHHHSIRNNSDKNLKLLCISTLVPVDVVGYPDSDKTAIFAMKDSSKGLMSGEKPWVRTIVKNQESVDYYEGED